MLSWLLALPGATTVLKWAAIAAAVAAVLFGARLSGRHVERIDRLEGNQQAARARVRDEISIQAEDDEKVDLHLKPPSRR